MKLMYVLLLAVATVYLLHVQHVFRKRYQQEAMSIYKIGVCVVALCVCNMLSIGLKSDFLATLAQGAGFFTSISFMLAFLYFVEEYTQLRKQAQRWRVVRVITLLLCAAQGVNVICNAWFHHVFVSSSAMLINGEPVRVFLPSGPSFTIHMVLCAVLASFAAIMLIYKLTQTRYFYRRRYWFVLGLMVVVLGFVVAYFSLRIPLDISLFVHIALVICLYYCKFVFAQRGLLHHTTRLIMKNMSDGIICFEDNGECAYINEKACELLGAPGDNRAAIKAFRDWESKGAFDTPEASYHTYRLPSEVQDRYYAVQKQFLQDRGGDQIGWYYTIYDRTDDVQTLHQESYRASHDLLTRLYNRDSFYKETAALIEANPDDAFLVLGSDYKDFKLVNELFGLQKGNELLLAMADILRRYAAQGAVCGRLDDDRFAMCIRQQDFDESVFLQELESIGSLIESKTFRLKVYVGVYDVSDRTLSVATMCDRAQMAIGTIKGDYTARLAHYTGEMMEKALYERTLVSEFDEALESGQFKAYLQPQADRFGGVDGAEALVRWVHPERGVIPPVVFIDLFERTGLIYRLDAFIWEEACRLLRKWQDNGVKDFYISVNISAQDFRYIDIFETLRDLIERYRLHPSLLRLEITETALMTDFAENGKVLRQLQNYGFLIEIDDFGSGYSSLNMLKNIRADALKIDRIFLKKSENEERSRIILSTVLELANKLGMSVVAEGVETGEQLQSLVGMGCRLFQGFYFDKPLPVEQFENRYLTQKRRQQ